MPRRAGTADPGARRYVPAVKADTGTGATLHGWETEAWSAAVFPEQELTQRLGLLLMGTQYRHTAARFP